MDIKWKNNRNKRIGIAVIALLVVTVINMLMYPGIIRRGEALLVNTQSSQTQESTVNTDILQELYKGCYVLYMEEMQRQSEENVTPQSLFIKEYPTNDTEEELSDAELKSAVDEDLQDGLTSWSESFETYRSSVDYCIINADGAGEKNTSNALEDALSSDEKKNAVLKQHYNDYFLVKFDAYGNMDLKPLYDKKIDPDALIKAFQQIDRSNLLQEEMNRRNGWVPVFESPKNFQVIFAVPVQTSDAATVVTLGTTGSSSVNDNYWERLHAYNEAGAGLMYVISVLIIIVFAFVMASPKLWKTEQAQNKKWHLMEAAFIGIFCGMCLYDTAVEMVWQYGYGNFSELVALLTSVKAYSTVVSLLGGALQVFLIYALWYLSVYYITPLFSLGLREYIRQYSFIYQIFPWLKKKWRMLKEEVEHIDFSEKSTKTIVKIVVINFIILAICSLMWFFGIWALIIYSVIVFYLIKRYYNKIGRDYQALLRSVNKIADGDLDSVIVENLGVFEPFKAELVKIRSGFKKAVDEEVKSQRMKTELITNVSHDLKTPLTAITTYTELLKKEDITEEERRSYIETLEKKSLRLKVLIEDLFEVSKATSNNIVLHPMELDVVNLLKQVSIEHTDKMTAQGLDLRWSVPEEKVILILDNQKTYRIFENLFVNVQKYAMPQSRVYITVETTGQEVEITMKNMSAEELNFKADEITERFVRGDSSRNTEGSGLGLAIAKSFTEAQKGRFTIEVDGDLFKVVIRFKCDNIEV